MRLLIPITTALFACGGDAPHHGLDGAGGMRPAPEMSGAGAEGSNCIGGGYDAGGSIGGQGGTDEGGGAAGGATTDSSRWDNWQDIVGLACSVGCDCPQPTNECILSLCIDGACVVDYAKEGTSCDNNRGHLGRCNGAGVCALCGKCSTCGG